MEKEPDLTSKDNANVLASGPIIRVLTVLNNSSITIQVAKIGRCLNILSIIALSPITRTLLISVPNRPVRLWRRMGQSMARSPSFWGC